MQLFSVRLFIYSSFFFEGTSLRSYTPPLFRLIALKELVLDVFCKCYTFYSTLIHLIHLFIHQIASFSLLWVDEFFTVLQVLSTQASDTQVHVS